MIKNVYNRPYKLLETPVSKFKALIYPKYSMLTQRQIDLTTSASIECYKSGLVEGVVVDCGIWRGGSTILLAKLFPDKKIYAFDSFCGFEAIEKSPYSILPPSDVKADTRNNNVFSGKERHVPGNEPILDFGQGYVSWKVSEEEVRNNIKESFDLIPEEHGIILTPGFVRNSLPTKIKEMGDIICLRIDVDAYAATYECLEILWDHVITSGVVIFDDARVPEANLAINNFFAKIERKNTYLPGGLENGCYIIK